MSNTNVGKLDKLEREIASRDPSGRDPEAILQDIEKLGSKPDLSKVETLTEELAQALGQAKQLTVATNRERYIRLLNGKLSAPAQFFDRALADRTSSIPGTDVEQGKALAFENPSPWPDPVEGSDVLEEVRNTFRRFAILDEDTLVVLALWVFHTYCFDIAWITPRLAITSPEKRCGKTLVLTLLRYLVAKPLMTANASPAAVFRCVEKVGPTLLIDEADTFLRGKDELRGILNSGHQRDGSVLRTVGDDHEPRSFSTFSPCAIALIGELPDTLADRSAAIRMTRKKPGETVERLRADRVGSFEAVRSRVMRWVNEFREILAHADPEVPDALNDRAADNWRALLAIADAAGGEWPTLARRAALETSSSKGDDSSARVLLLEDLRALFESHGAERLLSTQIVIQLIEREDRPWPEWKAGKPLTTRQLARLLGPFGIKPRQMRIKEKNAKGYELGDFRDTFERYLPCPDPKHPKHPFRINKLEEIPKRNNGGDVSDPESPQTPGFMRVVSDVSDREGGPREDTIESTREVVMI